MARIKIEDLPKDMKISKNDMRKIAGGTDTTGNITMNLQDAMNKEAQLMQLMSGVMKMHNDTTKVLINNLK